ncbi:hypothetical protein [Psychrobacter sp. I-STPA10]|uniref:hypothetical protein n=1 Tax=Psychrobacter sp. I-STPA10 TaxID=2585769 RepID=UPI001E626020|nr:hypothetical protein [Psychrobacter sp. I-STPA10]
MFNKDDYGLFRKAYYNASLERYEYKPLNNNEKKQMIIFLDTRNISYELRQNEVFVERDIANNPDLLAKYTKDFENEYLQDK